MKRFMLIGLAALTLGATTDSPTWTIVKLRGQIGVLTAENAKLKAQLEITQARLVTAEQWNAKIMIWFNFGGTFPKKPPDIAMKYCMDQGPAALPECWFCDMNHDGKVDAEDMKLWEVAK